MNKGIKVTTQLLMALIRGTGENVRLTLPSKRFRKDECMAIYDIAKEKDNDEKSKKYDELIKRLYGEVTPETMDAFELDVALTLSQCVLIAAAAQKLIEGMNISNVSFDELEEIMWREEIEPRGREVMMRSAMLKALLTGFKADVEQAKQSGEEQTPPASTPAPIVANDGDNGEALVRVAVNGKKQ